MCFSPTSLEKICLIDFADLGPLNRARQAARLLKTLGPAGKSSLLGLSDDLEEERVSHTSNVPALAETRPQARGIVVFVGSQQAFSDAFLRTVQAEIPFLSPIRLRHLDALESYAPPEGARIWLVVIENRLISMTGNVTRALRRAQQDLSRTDQPRPQVAMACNNQRCTTLDRRTAANLLYAYRAVDGFCGVLPMSRTMDVWLDILRLFLNRGFYYPAELFLDILEQTETQPHRDMTTPAPSGALMPHLTRRETEVIELVAGGLQNKQIAAQLDLSEHTVKLHIHNVISKLNVRNRTEAAMQYLQAQDGRASSA